MRRPEPAGPEMLFAAMADRSAAMVKDKEARQPFHLRNLKLTCETMLASLNAAKCPIPRVTRCL